MTGDAMGALTVASTSTAICTTFKNGTKVWLVDGMRHREDGPAIEWDDGDKEWYLNGEQHRANGPAVEYTDGHKEWWFAGRMYNSIAAFCDAAGITGEEKTIFLLKWQ